MRCVSFDLSYNGMPILEVIDNKLHKVLRRTSHFSHNLMIDELEVAAVHGLTPSAWFAIPHEERALMVAHLRATRVIEAINNYDNLPPELKK